MTVIRELDVTLDAEDAKAFPGLYCRGLGHERMLAVVPDIIDDVESGQLISPGIVYNIVDIARKELGTLTLADGSQLTSPLLAHRMSGASRLAFIVVTIGDGVAGYISDLHAADELVKAFVSEEIANAYLFDVSSHVEVLIEEAATADGMQVSGPLSPGDEGFPMELQSQVLALAGAKEIGIELSEASMMRPRFSISIVIGLGKRMHKWSQLDNCAVCASRDSCRHRKAAEAMA